MFQRAVILLCWIKDELLHHPSLTLMRVECTAKCHSLQDMKTSLAKTGLNVAFCREPQSFCIISLVDDGMKMDRKLQSFISSEVKNVSLLKRISPFFTTWSASKEHYPVSMSPKQRLEHCHPLPHPPEKELWDFNTQKALGRSSAFFSVWEEKVWNEKRGRRSTGGNGGAQRGAVIGVEVVVVAVGEGCQGGSRRLPLRSPLEVQRDSPHGRDSRSERRPFFSAGPPR